MSSPNSSIEETLTEIKNRLDATDAIKVLQSQVETLNTDVTELKNRIAATAPPKTQAEEKKEEKPKTPEEIAGETRKARASFRRYSIAALVILGVWLTWGLWFDEYGDGEKAGIITKIRHEGMLFKTYEGEMLLGGSGSGQTWAFSIDNSNERGENIDKIVNDLEEAQRSGKRVRLFYVEESWVGNWRGATGHLIQRVEFLDN